MNEAGFWVKVRGALHAPPGRVCRKLTDAFTAGTPDAFFCARGVTTFLELKYLDRWPARVRTPVRVGVTVEQHRYLELLRDAGVPALVLLGVGREWLLLPPDARWTASADRSLVEAAALARGVPLGNLAQVLVRGLNLVPAPGLTPDPAAGPMADSTGQGEGIPRVPPESVSKGLPGALEPGSKSL